MTQDIRSGKTVDEQREEARRKIAQGLMWFFFGILVITLILGSTLVFEGKITAENFVNLIVVVSAIFSGLLGSAVTFYYSGK